ncbi:MAG: hypothetical protein GEV03_20940 [Streptosporangiales bacterium]|nr:hypothetical protein [Streptosporangiales bacterium]
MKRLDEEPREPRYEVVWPLGKSAVEIVDESQRAEDLDGQTVAFVWDYLFRGPEMFEAIKQELQERCPGARFVDYDVFGNIHGSDAEEKANVAALPARLREHRVDSAVVAVGA